MVDVNQDVNRRATISHFFANFVAIPFRISGLEGHFDKKVLLKLSSTLKLLNFENGMKIIGNGTTSMVCAAFIGIIHTLWCGLLSLSIPKVMRRPECRIRQ